MRKSNFLNGGASLPKPPDFSHGEAQNHGEHKELYSARVEDATKADGKTLKINRRVNSQTEAEHLAANELREKNKDENKMSLTVRGNFNLSAGSVITIENFGAFSGRYLLEKVTHKVGSSGYETSATAHLCLGN